MTPVFSLAERDRRWDLARTFMAREGLDALLVFGEHEDAGPAPVAYDTWFTNGRPGATVVVTAEGAPVSLLPGPMYIMDHLESSRRGETMWIPPENLRPARSSRTIVEALHASGLDAATIGVVGLGSHMPWHPEGIIPYGLWNAVLTALPRADFRPVDLAFGQLILPLGAEEIAVLRRSAAIGDAMVEAMVATAAPGVPESHVYAAGMAAGYRQGTLPAAMHLWSGPDVIAAGPPAWGQRPQEPRTLADGDVIYAEVFANFGGRHTQNQVTIAVGDVHEDFHRAALVARAAYDAGLAALRPGRTFGDLVDAMHEPIDAADGWPFLIAVHSLNPGLSVGKGRGLFSRIPGTEGYPRIADHPAFLPEMELVPGMSFAFEPNYAYGRHLAHLGGTVVVGEDTPIELNAYTAQLLHARGDAA
ncbi:aminopeptidase P family protein [Actinoplanes rectilineatus]|uniref:aminopeptidase P family protein n=1 Tax=Actinoplanes rectilineatus TaxID=113571 RepID=UPI0005F29DDF|nr:aminopeptidase P family protein [Actinoplanes rectilineatus]